MAPLTLQALEGLKCMSAITIRLETWQPVVCWDMF